MKSINVPSWAPAFIFLSTILFSIEGIFHIFLNRFEKTIMLDAVIKLFLLVVAPIFMSYKAHKSMEAYDAGDLNAVEDNILWVEMGSGFYATTSLFGVICVIFHHDPLLENLYTIAAALLMVPACYYSIKILLKIRELRNRQDAGVNEPDLKSG